ncbi:hypothetical protein XBLMG947_0946 [Xanthomonas bromi]|uniref:Uncharacterized protein n=1 Tax=Xanthomonas bromi TaxID=56449 RepID=A0A1C3NID6_9XANT|nr:hypothetical protein XBLMG947_0946 [Xanthomonas bromi]
MRTQVLPRRRYAVRSESLQVELVSVGAAAIGCLASCNANAQ